MELHELKPAKGSKKKRKRLGRGTGSGLGKTSGRGHKGSGSRSGYGKRIGQEGGQMPLQRRVPKRGFTNIFKKKYQIINVADLNRCPDSKVSRDSLKKDGIISKSRLPIKVLGVGDIKKAYNVQASAFSKTAVSKIEAAGGKVEVV